MRLHIFVMALGSTLLQASLAYGQATAAASSTEESQGSASSSETYAEPAASYGGPFRLEQLLPESVAQTTDINAWGWFSYLHDSDREESSYWEADVAVGITQRLGDRVAATADMHYINDNNFSHGFLEQAFITAEVSEQAETLVTVGKFNASFGVEARNEWDRLTGTTSLLFGAQPQDLVGVMVTQPLGSSGVKLRPFIATQFQGHADFSAPPSGGLLVEYRPSHSLRFALTNWVGPGLVPPEVKESTEDEEYAHAYASNEYAVGNWTGPDLYAVQHGLLYFADANVQWNPRPDLTIAAEALFAMTGRSASQFGWGGALVLANYDITDRWRVFGRWSFLNDALWMVTGAAQTRHELSVGAAFQVISGVELRGEYRHDFARTGDLDSLSAHLIFSF